MYSIIPILQTSKGSGNWFEKSESSRNRGKNIITEFDLGGETTFCSSYWEARKTEGLRNWDSIVCATNLLFIIAMDSVERMLKVKFFLICTGNTRLGCLWNITMVRGTCTRPFETSCIPLH